MGGSVHKAPIMRKAFPCHDVIVMSWDIHDDVIEWKHFPRYWPFVCGEFTGLRWIPLQWRGALMFSLICAWINGWVNNRGAGDLRRHRAHYDVIVIIYRLSFTMPDFIMNIGYTVQRKSYITLLVFCAVTCRKINFYCEIPIWTYPYVGNINAPICLFFFPILSCDICENIANAKWYQTVMK